MNRYPHSGGILLMALALAIGLPATARSQILVVAPHPDDDVIIAAGVVHRAHQRGEAVRVVYVTNGDANGLEIAAVRQGEAVAAQAILGTPEDSLMFLGYPDGELRRIRSDYAGTKSTLTSAHGVTATYATRGLGATDYHRHRFGAPGPYNWPTMVQDLADIIGTFQPKHIFTTSEWEEHGDHTTTHALVIEAARKAIAAAPRYDPTVHQTTVWPGDETWPAPADPSQYFTPIPRRLVSDPRALIWRDRESLDVPGVMQSNAANPKYLAIAAHESQGGVNRYIGRWLHKDEFFWSRQVAGRNRPPVPNAGLGQSVHPDTVVTLDGTGSSARDGGTVRYQWRQVAGPPVTLSDAQAAKPTFVAPPATAADVGMEFELVVSDDSLTSVPDSVRILVQSPTLTYGPNVAPLATVTASTERAGSGQTAAKVVDGVVDGYPADSSREWVTAGEGVGAWIAMTWAKPVSVGKIVLCDRPNADDQVTAGSIEFSDGSTLAIGPLANNGAPVEYRFTPRTIRSLRLTVTEVSRTTANTGLAEVQVFEVTGDQRPPEAAVVTPAPPAAGRPPSTSSAKPAQGRAAPTPPPSSPSNNSTNIVATAAVTASSDRYPLQGALKVIDGVIKGYPEEPSAEWVTNGERAGAWIELRWAAAHLIDRVRLHDRPNADDQILAATLTFSDGTSVPVDALPNDGTGLDVVFPPRRVQWIRLTITKTSAATANTGLAEILVFERAS